MAKRRTPEEQWEHLQEQAERARRRLARARDPRVEEVERVLTGLSRLMNDEAWPTDQERNTIATLEVMLARLVDEAVKP